MLYYWKVSLSELFGNVGCLQGLGPILAESDSSKTFKFKFKFEEGSGANARFCIDFISMAVASHERLEFDSTWYA